MAEERFYNLQCPYQLGYISFVMGPDRHYCPVSKADCCAECNFEWNKEIGGIKKREKKFA